MKLVIRPIQDQQRELDLTHRLVSAIAEELWRLYGGNEQLNWIEAELHLQRIVGEVRAEACETGQGAAASRRIRRKGARNGRAVATVVG